MSEDKVPPSLKLWLDTFDYIAIKKAELKIWVDVFKIVGRRRLAEQIEEKYLQEEE